jgi:hypothetical protein
MRFWLPLLWKLQIIVWRLPRKILLQLKLSTWIPNTGSGRYFVHVPLGHPTPHLCLQSKWIRRILKHFADEMLQSYVLRHTFENSIGYNERMVQDAVTLPSISTMDNGACIELLRGAQLSERMQRKPGGLLGVINKACSSYKAGKDGEQRDDELLKDVTSKFTVHASFVAERNLFGINHYAGPASYDVTHFVEKDSDLLDSASISLLRNSSDRFVSKLLSGPSLAAERHSKDDQIIVQAQVSSRPLRNPHLSFLQTTLYLQCRMNIPAWILARRIPSPRHHPT